MNIVQNKLDKILRLHKMWLDNEPDGERADFPDSDLMFAQNAGMEYMDVLDFLLAFQR